MQEHLASALVFSLLASSELAQYRPSAVGADESWRPGKSWRGQRETDGLTGGSVCHAACHFAVGQQWLVCDWWRPRPGACQSLGDKHPSGMHILASN